MKISLLAVVLATACTTTVKGEGPGGSTSSSTSSGSSTSSTSSSGGTSSSTSTSGGAGAACADSFDCKGIPYCPCPNGARDGIGSWECSGTCFVDCSDPLCSSQ